MRSLLLLLFSGLVSSFFAPSAQQPSSVSRAATVLQESLAAQEGSQSLADVTLSGTVRRIAGADDESGTVVLKGLADASAKIQLTLPSGTRSEVRSFDTSGAITGTWSGPDGAAHPIASHNLIADTGWFPAFTLAAFANSASAVLTYIGPETKSGQSVLHLKASQQFATLPKGVAALYQHLSETDIFLDAATLLPVAIAFSIHPDDNALLDIPVEIQFSGYHSVSGVQIPFHIQKFINNSLTLDLQFDSATINSGLSPAIFTVGVGLQPGSCLPPVDSGVSSTDFVVAGLQTGVFSPLSVSSSPSVNSGPSVDLVAAGLQPGSSSDASIPQSASGMTP